jgi:hypothetical protein
MTTTLQLDPRTRALADCYDQDPITLLDDLVQIMSDEGHDDLATSIHNVLLKLDSRRLA